MKTPQPELVLRNGSRIVGVGEPASSAERLQPSGFGYMLFEAPDGEFVEAWTTPLGVHMVAKPAL